MAVPVNIYVEEDSLLHPPVPGVVVAVFNPLTMEAVAYGTTDQDGMAAFLLPGGSYEARFFKAGFSFSNPKSVAVTEPAVPESPNGFTATALPVGVFGVPIDPRLCRCVGRFVNFQNLPMPNMMIRIAAEADLTQKTPKVVDGNMVGPSAMEVRTDQNGFVSLDLLRTGKYWAIFAGEEDELWSFVVPNRPNANLVELIHPQPVSLSYDQTVAPGNQVTVQAGSFLFVPFTVLFSDYQEHLVGIDSIIEFTNSAGDIADITFQSNVSRLLVKGLAAGTLTVSVAVRPGLFPNRLPDYSISAPVLNVTITP